MYKIYDFDGFCKALLECGFSMGGGNSEGIFALIPWDWQQEPPYETRVSWHTGIPETDPWEWRMRVLNERNDIAYAKLFFNKSGYITREWYPYFFACRRKGMSFEEEYMSGTVSREAKRIYGLITDHGTLPMHEIKRLGGFGREEKYKFDRAMFELQMKMYITMCGSKQKKSKMGLEYGWNSTVFCTAEDFWESDVTDLAASLSCKEVEEKITEHIFELNENADPKKLRKFICGN